MNSKTSLRKHYRAVRNAIAEADRSHRSQVLADLLLAIDRLAHAGSIFVYVSAGSEVITHGLISSLLEQSKQVAVPRVLNEAGQMQAMLIRSANDLSPGRFGILEPTTREVLEATPDLAIVPGLAFTRSGKRLGQGGGYYDRYLAQHPAAYKIGICFNEQVADQLPTDEYDIGMDEVITA